MDFIAIGDTVVDEFIRLKEATVSCDEQKEHCTISMAWGDKIPFDFAVLLPAVGNAANAAVAAARLGLSTGLISNVGKDHYGEEILKTLAHEGIDTRYITSHPDIPTNHHYVLWYESERTILIRHEVYPYALPTIDTAPRWVYLSSLGDHSEAYHDELLAWLTDHPDTRLAFQPGTFQIRMGKERFGKLYARADIVACNKEEAELILGIGETRPTELLRAMHDLGPRCVIITDGPRGAYASDGTRMYSVPMYPDPKPPFERTGAGDATTSTIVAALALGKPLEEALLWGPINAMSVVQKIGAQEGLLSREALEHYLTTAPAEYAVSPLS